MTDNNSGLITEQGFVAGSFGFNPISESEKKNIEDKKKQDQKDKK